jgi:imidazolonepropionase-like amidohydrolase
MTRTSNRRGRPRPVVRTALALSIGLILPPAGTSRAQTVAITGGKVYPVSGAPIENGTVLVRDGKIVAVGADVAVPADARRIDATGKWVTPGLVNAATQLGVVEIGAVAETRDVAARGKDSVAAAFTVWDGFNPRSVLIPPARADGITTVNVVPGGGLISGQAAVVDLFDGSASEMLLKSPVAMVAQVGATGQAGVSARGELIVRLRELLEDAKFYAGHRRSFDTGDTRQFAARRLDLEALVPVADGRLPLMLTADRASDIEAALALAKDYPLKLIIAGGAEAWEVADELAAAKVPVFTGAMNNIPSSFAALGTRQDNAALLRKAGVAVAIIGNAGGGDEEAFNVRNLKYEAGNAVAYGMRWDDALRAVTLTPAEALGIADRVGSLRPGREANVVVWSGDPFEFSTRVEHVLVHGRELPTKSRQDMLMERYKTLPPKYLEQ